MNRMVVFVALTMVLLAHSICQADSLVITYRSGKTQTVVLDEPSQGVSSWQFVGESTAPQQPPQMKETVNLPAPEQIKDDKRLTEKPPESKSGVRIKWNAKPLSD
ncbi:MAG: hypothetical protein PHY09_15740 [Desulfuromonadaceae bacterium]|nr:hypothetical protein [Desulfuromonadaceae bacterium]MDD5104408.1 hypothetical protein [Desulfuromonadaceae bacterium]